MPSFSQPPAPPSTASRAAASEGLRAAALLLGPSTEVLPRLLEGDPLGLRPRVRRRLEERALLVDGQRLVARLVALCALRGRAWRGTPALEPWLEACAEEALAGIVAEEPVEPPCDPRPGARPGPPPVGRSAGSPWTVFAPPLGLDAERLRGACARFNRLPVLVREAFFRVVLDGQAPDVLARARGTSLTEVARAARAALELLLTTLDPDRDASRRAAVARATGPGAPERTP